MEIPEMKIESNNNIIAEFIIKISITLEVLGK